MHKLTTDLFQSLTQLIKRIADKQPKASRSEAKQMLVVGPSLLAFSYFFPGPNGDVVSLLLASAAGFVTLAAVVFLWLNRH